MIKNRMHWVFGYGSLIWKQDFPVIDIQPAYIKGWSRRFWQGSHDHRGLPSDPGRVLTLIETPDAICKGRALLVQAEVFPHLDHREKNGYERIELQMYLGNGIASGVTYIASPNNPAYLGPAPLTEIAQQISRSAGPSGSNADYVLELAQALRELNINDPHVFEIEALLNGN